MKKGDLPSPFPSPEAGRMLQAGPDIDQETSLFPWVAYPGRKDSSMALIRERAPLLATPQGLAPNKKRQ